MEDIITLNLPGGALRGLTVFPALTISFDVEREASIFALDNAMDNDRRLFLVTQRDIATARPQEKDLYTIGTIAHILQIVKTSDTSVRVIVEGEDRARIRRLWQTKPFLQANVEVLEDDFPGKTTPRVEALLRRTYTLFDEYRNLVNNLDDNYCAAVLDQTDPGVLADFLAQNLQLRHMDRQKILEELHPIKRLTKMNEVLAREVQIVSLESEMEAKVRHQVAHMQKDMFLREQMKVLQHELGDDGDEEIDEYNAHLAALKVSDEVRAKLQKEIDRLAKQPYTSAEAAVLRNYLDVCMELPWGTETKDRADVNKAQQLLDKDHYGLDKVKERILEFIAVRQINPEAKGKIICLVGPPGVGKTSIAVSVAKAMNRKVTRVSLGGVRDEADIRGHRKTYIGAMPGRIVEGISRCGAMNPLLVLDEVDKMASDVRGDPASALLEVLDAEQNNAFRDHFLEIPLDLSRVMFITTANTTDTIPRPLLDRMEVIELSSYTDVEKIEIARRHLLPKQMAEHGVKKTQLRISDGALQAIIRGYTRESGVRVLERELGKVCRKTAITLVRGDVKRIDLTEKNVEKYLGTVRYTEDMLPKQDPIGLVNGLAWTQAGGEMLQVEVNVMEGTGKLELTGNLGTVMQESAKAALSYLRSRAEELGIDREFYKNRDIHIHFPEGAVPKDGPSAGIAIATAMLSALTGRKVRRDVAMTGEVTLRGRVLAIGGLKEKTMASMRSGIKTVIIPQDNAKDLDDIDPTVRKTLRFVPVETVEAVFATARVPEKSEQAVDHLATMLPEQTKEVRYGYQL